MKTFGNQLSINPNESGHGHENIGLINPKSLK